MSYWLLKSEPSVWSWDDQRSAGKTFWDGVRNHQAAASLKTMQVGDRAFFYHSNEGKAIMGIVRVTRAALPDPTDASGRFVMVEVEADERFRNPVRLETLKSDTWLADMVFLRQPRLSVSAVTPPQWKRICVLGGVS